MTFGSRLKLLRQEKGLTQAQFGEYFNLAESTISLYETGKRTPHYDILKRFALFLNVTLDFLLSHTDSRYPGEAIEENPQAYACKELYKPVQIPVVHKINCEKGVVDYELLPTIHEWLPLQAINDGNYFWLLINDSRLTGEAILPGDLVLIKEQAWLDRGELGVVLQGNDYAVLRVYKDEHSILLQTANPVYPPIILSGKECTQLRIIGKVIQAKRFLSALTS